jgi:hypothetical protein
MIGVVVRDAPFATVLVQPVGRLEPFAKPNSV